MRAVSEGAGTLGSISMLGVAAVLGAGAWADHAHAQRGPAGVRSAQVDFWPIRGSVYMLIGAGANITASVGPDGVFLVDAGGEGTSDAVLAALDRLKAQLRFSGALDVILQDRGGAETRSRFPVNAHALPKPIRYIVNTNVRPEHTGGNLALAATGVTYSGGNVAGTIGDSAVGAAVLAHENVLVRLVGAGAPFGMLPTETYFTDEYKLSTFFNGEGIRLVHMPSASTDGDTIVYFRGSDVISTGDVFSMDTFPIIDVEQGGGINGVIGALNYVLKLAIPEFRTEGGTMVIPGHGRLADSADVGYYRDMVTIIRDQVQHLIDKGMTLEQVMAARPTSGYEGRFGADTGPWTTEMFTEAVFRSLTEGQ